MPIKSYLVHTAPNRATALAVRLAAIPGCGVVAAENRDALVLVTDTPSEEAEAEMRARLESLGDLTALTLVSAFQAEDDLITIGAPSAS